MADLRNPQTRAATAAAGAHVDIDEGLRSYMTRVYNYMALGIALTAVITMALANSPAILSAVIGMRWVFFIAIIAASWFGPNLVLNAKSPAVAHAAYWGYAALWAVAIAPMVVAYLSIDPGIVVQAFAITAALFGSMSLIGYTTKKNLNGIGQFAVMAVIGVIIAAVVNFFLQSTMLALLGSAVYVVAISAITAWETQSIKNMYLQTDGAAVVSRKAIFGAFLLYGSFISMFIHILQLIGFMSSD